MKSWITLSNVRRSPKFRLFCFHHAGGNSQAFRTWHEELPTSVQVGAIELPGHGLRFSEPLMDRWQPVVAGIVEHLVPLLDVPYVFFGHSMGALLAFETARTIQKVGLPGPRTLFVSGRGAPHSPRKRPPIHALPEAEFLQALREYQGCPPEVLASRELLDLFVPILRADFAIGETYEFSPGAMLDHPIHVLIGRNDEMVDTDGLARWNELTRTEAIHHSFPGGHFYLQEERHHILRLVARALVGEPERLDIATGA